MSLQELAEHWGIDTHHVDGLGRECRASDEALIAILRALGCPIEVAEQAESLLRARLSEPTPVLPPCAVGTAFEDCSLLLHGPAEAEFRAQLTREDGQRTELQGQLGALPAGEGHSFRLSLGALPVGYHSLRVHCEGQEADCALLIAPRQAYGAPQGERHWGVFAPLYALRSEAGAGVGDFAGLGRMMKWAGGLGASYFGCLPLLAANYREAPETSPYSPVSRLFWNELYLDVQALSSRFGDAKLRAFLASPEYRDKEERLRALELVDYRESSALKREVLQKLSSLAWSQEGASLEAYLEERPELASYARFRACMEKRGETWPQWPEEQRRGLLSAEDYEESSFRYHVFVQWAVEQQLGSVSGLDCKLYLDLSVGVSGSSYDVWRHQEHFVRGVDVGAPPDGLFAGGQNWALPPLHPERSREGGHRYFAACVRNHMRHSGVLRIDHVMGLHRLYWVPSALGATEGLYVNYPAEELYAILLIESQRNQCALVGEDLGTVPDSVRPAMTEAGIHRLYVGQFATEWRESEQHLGLQTPPTTAIASLDTHDTATFAGWFAGTDLQVDAETLMKSWTEELASGPAAGLMITLEDLWLEAEPQNRPGTTEEVPNWRHRMVRSEQEIRSDEAIASWLRYIDGLRSGAIV